MAVVLALLIATLIAGSVLAPAPRRARLAWVAVCVLAAVAAPPIVLGLQADRGVFTVSIALAVALLAVATWLARGADPGAGPGDAGQRREQPPGPLPWDWSHFDRAREDWSRPRTPV